MFKVILVLHMQVFWFCVSSVNVKVECIFDNRVECVGQLSTFGLGKLASSGRNMA